MIQDSSKENYSPSEDRTKSTEENSSLKLVSSENLPAKQTPSRIKVRELVLGIGVGIIGTLAITKLVSVSPETSSDSATLVLTETQGTAQRVTVGRVDVDFVNRTLKATGTVAAFESIPILSPANGLQIERIFVDEGDIVKPGQLLATLDNSVESAQLQQAQATIAQREARLAELRAGNRVEEIAQARASVQQIQAQITQAEADLSLAQRRVERNRSLEVDGAITRDRLDELLNDAQIKQAILQQFKASFQEAQEHLSKLEAGPRKEVIAQAVAELAEAKAQYQINAARLKDTKIISPVGGKISQREARVGDITKSSQALFTIIENNRLELQVKIPETQLTLIRPGQTVKITSDADSNLKLQGKVREIEPIVDETSRQATVAVDLPRQTALKPGMFLSVDIVTNSSRTLTTPMNAVLPQTDGSYLVYLVQADNTVKAQVVEVGEILPNQRMEIVQGLKSGDRLVLKGAAYLKDGDPINY